MKKLFYAAFTVLLAACSSQPSTVISVANSSNIARTDEIVELPVKEVLAKLNGPGSFVIKVNGVQVPYQITFDSLLIFPVTVAANSTVNYTVEAGKPDSVVCAAYGKHYPERVDDIAWENDKVAFRTYGPALQASGERAFGYDVWTKRVPEMVVVERYANELNVEKQAEIKSLREAGKKAEADSLYKTICYHVDHGNGLDCYKVGPTLGGGTAALMPKGEILYPYCWDQYQIVDNGPLRFTVKLTYKPTELEGKSFVEKRTISLDKGSQLNKAVVEYEGLEMSYPVAAGFVIHPENPEAYVLDSTYIGYADLTDNVNNGNGVIYVGAVFPENVSATVKLFDEKESAELRGGAKGHVLGVSDYVPGKAFTYYFGSGWSKAGFDSMDVWKEYLSSYSAKLKAPLIVTVK